MVARRRSVLFIVHKEYPLHETRVRRQAEAVAGAGWRTTVLSLGSPGLAASETLNRVHVIRTPVTRRHQWTYRGLLSEYGSFWVYSLRHCLANRYDRVVVANPPDFLVFAALPVRLRGGRVILDVHDLMLHRPGALPAVADLAGTILSYLNLRTWRDGDAAAWALPFPYATRFGFTEAGTPNVVTTEAVVTGLVDAVQGGLTSDMRDARAGARFVTRFLTSDFQPEGWFRYTPHGGDDIINGCALAVKALLRVHEIDPDETLRRQGLAAARSIARLQRNDGSWPYSTKVGKDWVDGFHTGFVLEALSLAVRESDDSDGLLRRALARGLRYFREHLLGEEGRALYYPDRPWPLSAMCAAEALQTICSAHEAGVAELSEAEPVAHTTLRLFVRSDGRVAYERHAFMTDWREFPRWAAAPVAAALARCAWMACQDQQRSALVTGSAG